MGENFKPIIPGNGDERDASLISITHSPRARHGNRDQNGRTQDRCLLDQLNGHPACQIDDTGGRIKTLANYRADHFIQRIMTPDILPEKKRLRRWVKYRCRVNALGQLIQHLQFR